MYQTPYNQYTPAGEPLFDVKAAQSHFEEFYEDIFTELCKYGEIEELNVCSNLGDHLNGNVYVKYFTEEDAMKALNATRGRYYAGFVLFIFIFI
jgi:splicing factor U2AF subunit